MYSTRRPSGTWTRVSSGSDYGNVVSNYAVALQQALQAQAQTDLEAKVFNYENGLLSYADLKKFLNDRMGAELPGSQRELDLRQTLANVDAFENKKNRDIERAKLEAKFSKGGISAAEKVVIENELLRFFKQGTPEYSQQLSTISGAKELERQEKKNERVAELEGKLSEGGLSTSEEIQIMEEARSLSEKGSQEYSELTGKIGTLRETERDEKLSEARNQEVSKMYDQFNSDGELTNKEILEINKVEQKYAVPGTEEYIKLKQNEADILDAISSEGRGAGNDAVEAEEKAAETEYWATDARLKSLESMFKTGEITYGQYQKEAAQLMQKLETSAEAAGGQISEQEKGTLLNTLNQYLEQSSAVKGGQSVVVAGTDGKKMVLGKEALDNAFSNAKKATVYWDEEGDRADEFAVIRAEVNGKDGEYFVNEKGELEELARLDSEEGEETSYRRTGNIVKSSTSKTTPTRMTVPGTSPRSAGSVLGSATKAATKSVQAATSSAKAKTSSIKSSVKSTAKSSSSATAKAVTAAYNSVKKTNTNGTSYATAKPIATIGKVQVKQGNIKGTLDFGVTEKISSTARKAINKISSLFKKR